MAARVDCGIPPSKPTGTTRIFAPQPFELMPVACCQGIPLASFVQALMQVMPGALLLSGLVLQSTNARLSGSSSVIAVYGLVAFVKAFPTANAICVSSV